MLKSHIKEIIKKIISESKDKQRIIIAVDGRCAAGKTTFANELAKMLDINVFRMDDFFLPQKMKTKERLSAAGENIDHERFLAEVLLPVKEGKEFNYYPYDCHTDRFKNQVLVLPKRVSVVEGSYSCHKNLWNFYDYHVFLDIDEKTQQERILARNGEKVAKIFKEKWIPLEEIYFSAFRIKERCEFVLN